SYGTFQGGLSFGGSLRRWSYGLGIAGVRIGEQVERDGFDAVDSGGRAMVTLGKATTLAFHFGGRRSAAAGLPAGSGGPLYALNRAVESRESASWLGGLTAKHVTDRWSHQFNADLWRQTQDQN